MIGADTSWYQTNEVLEQNIMLPRVVDGMVDKKKMPK